MKAVALNCTLKPFPEPSNTEGLMGVVLEALGAEGVETETIRVVDHDVRPGVESDMGDGDQWPAIRTAILSAEILIVATPTWVGRPASVAQRVIERMDAMLSETDDEGRPVAYNRVAGVVVTGNEDGAHHVISEVAGALIDIGYTVPGQSWTGAERVIAASRSSKLQGRGSRLLPDSVKAQMHRRMAEPGSARR